MKINSKIQNISFKIFLAALLGVILIIVLYSFELKIKGRFTNAITGILFLLSFISMALFAKLNFIKYFSRVVFGILLLSSFLCIFWERACIVLFLIVLLAPIFDPPTIAKNVGNGYKVEIRYGGFMSCGEAVSVTESKFMVLDKLVHSSTPGCLLGVNKVEVVSFDESSFELLIYHDGRNHKENPLKYEYSN